MEFLQQVRGQPHLQGRFKDWPMITDDDQPQQTVEQLRRMCRALAALRAEVLPINPRQFALMAEGPVEEIQRLHAQIDAYVGEWNEAGGSRPIATRDIAMSIVTIEEAQAKLPELIDKLAPGEEVIITRNQQPVAKLVGQERRLRKPRQPGSAKEKLIILAEDDEHLKDFAKYMA